MASLPQIVRDAWEERDGPAILATVGKGGVPNIVYVTCVSLFGEDRFVIADNYFDKTRRNILEGCRGSLLFIDRKRRSYQIKGSFEYHENGEFFTHMKSVNPPQHPGHAAAVLRLEEAYSGADRLC